MNATTSATSPFSPDYCVECCQHEPHHADRLARFRLPSHCDKRREFPHQDKPHGCPVCFVDAAGDYCRRCFDLVEVLWRREGGPADPYCMRHGTADPDNRDCALCRFAVRAARRKGWTGVTGHDGPDCCHCELCGLCQGSGRVCRHCHRCPEHAAETGADCEQWRWDKFVRDERSYFVHSYFDRETRRWAPR